MPDKEDSKTTERPQDLEAEADETIVGGQARRTQDLQQQQDLSSQGGTSADGVIVTD